MTIPNVSFEWIPVYEAIAKQIRLCDTDQGRQDLLHIAHRDLGIKTDYVDPFALILSFNRSGKKNIKNRVAKIEKLMKSFGITEPFDGDLSGIPTTYARFAIVSHNKTQAKTSWKLFDLIVDKGSDSIHDPQFVNLMNEVVSFNSKGRFNDLTKLFYVINPHTFFPLQGYNNTFIKNKYGIDPDKIVSHSAAGYVDFIEQLKHKTDTPFWELVHEADPHYMDEASNDEFLDPSSPVTLNTILYGPPGTGKTYNTISYTVKICDPEYYEQHENNYDELAVRFNQLKSEQRVIFTTFHQSYSYEDFVEGIRPVLDDSSGLRYELVPGVFKALCNIAKKDLDKNYVIVIDEINRGNISEIFGELITLIEPDKREGSGPTALTAKLPYSKEKFGVPANVYIVATMNTADKSLTQIDTALRRRFDFIEMMPDYELLKDNEVDGVKLDKLLEAMNARIAALYDREHEIGHSYLMHLDGDLDKLKEAFEKKIIPLLQEYFYDDYSKIRQVLNEADETAGSFIVKDKLSEKYAIEIDDGETCWKLGDPNDWATEDFKKIYEVSNNIETNDDN